jgi:hypothetical protein
MIELEHAPQKAQILADLKRTLDAVRRTHRMGQSLVDAVGEVLAFTTERCKRMGIAFPPLVPLILQRSELIMLVRRDWDLPALQTHIVNTCFELAGVDMLEIAQEVKRAFPHFRPEKLAFADDKNLSLTETYNLMRE